MVENLLFEHQAAANMLNVIIIIKSIVIIKSPSNAIIAPSVKMGTINRGVSDKARIVEGDEWLEAFEALVEKYSGDQPEQAKHKEITGCTKAYIIAIDVEHITGKEAIEYVNAKI